MEMIELKRDLLTTKYTKVEVEKEYTYNAPHFYAVRAVAEKSECGNQQCLTRDDCPYNPKSECAAYSAPHEPYVGCIHFQEGPIKECGVNGVCNEDLLNIVIDRLEHFQNSEFSCRENAMAITKLEEALLWLRKRTMAREQRGVEGTHIV
ncbi:MAG: hypothetical protein IJA67_10470 [Oscillospiraceae bacterium]|nr:hypothetical protein [Oscillospiraceae bacterium]